MSAYIDELKAELEEVRTARREVIANGQSVNIQGSHSYTKADLSALSRRETQLLRLIAAELGISRRRREVPHYE